MGKSLTLYDTLVYIFLDLSLKTISAFLFSTFPAFIGFQMILFIHS
jgi:hypothetical protein